MLGSVALRLPGRAVPGVLVPSYRGIPTTTGPEWLSIRMAPQSPRTASSLGRGRTACAACDRGVDQHVPPPHEEPCPPTRRRSSQHSRRNFASRTPNSTPCQPDPAVAYHRARVPAADPPCPLPSRALTGLTVSSPSPLVSSEFSVSLPSMRSFRAVARLDGSFGGASILRRPRPTSRGNGPAEHVTSAWAHYRPRSSTASHSSPSPFPDRRALMPPRGARFSAWCSGWWCCGWVSCGFQQVERRDTSASPHLRTDHDHLTIGKADISMRTFLALLLGGSCCRSWVPSSTDSLADRRRYAHILQRGRLAVCPPVLKNGEMTS